MSERSYDEEPAGPLAFMVRNRVAANLLMLGIIAAGLVSLNGIVFDMWATLPFNQVEVSMAYPGATPEEVEESIVGKIEERVASLDNVKSVNAVAAPGVASVRVELKSGADMGRALDDIESAVGGIQSFPEGAERPQFREMTNLQSVVRLIVFGDLSERALKETAYWIEDELAALPGVSEVDATGARDYEISIEVPQRRLRALGLTLEDVAAAIRSDSLNLSGGRIKTGESEVRVRTLGQRYDQADFEDVIVLAGGDGSVIRLGQIAEVHDGFAETDSVIRHQDKPAVFIEVFRIGDEKVVDVADAVKAHVKNVLIPSLPPGADITVWNDDSEFFDACVDLLLKNGSLGLLLVLIALALFLEIRVSLWVVVGIAVSVIGVLAVVLALDLVVDANALFAFVLAIGIVVDEAIVVSENIYRERRRGVAARVAAIRGVRRIAVPLTFAVVTSMVAFSPLMFLPGGQGEIIFPLAVILISMLAISLVESLLILPAHLSHLPDQGWVPSSAIERFLRNVQTTVDRAFSGFVEGSLHRWLQFATEQPAVVIAGGVGLLIISVSLLPAGIVGTVFVNQIEGDFVTATLEMPEGTVAERTFEVAKEVESAGHRVIERLERDRSDDGQPLLDGVIVTVGQGPRVEGGGLIPQPGLNPQGHIATVEFKLLGAEQREIAARAVKDAWRDEVGVLPHVRGLSFSSELITFGNPVEVSLSHPDPERLIAAADSVVDNLRQIEGVFDVRSDHAPGVREMQLELRPEARTLGLTVEQVALQVRAAFFGAEAVRVQRGREEVRVYVRLPRAERDAVTNIERYIVRTPTGGEVPLGQVARLREDASPEAIRRKDSKRIVTVTADVDPSVIAGSEATGIIVDTVLPELANAHPGLTYRAGGEAEQQLESLDSLFRGFVLVLFLIYALLAVALRSYSLPVIVMSVIPFGLIGVVVGHVAIGIDVSFTSAMGFVGLSGVVVNDSLVMLDFINEQRKAGVPTRQAIIEGAKQRFRPIMLTSVTTFLAFIPLILERAIHAKFLVPFAASLGFGILITTALLMLLVPALTTVLMRGRRGLPMSDAPRSALASA